MSATAATRSATGRDGRTEASTPTRTAALWVPDWPVLAAMTAGEVPGHVPACLL